MTLTPQFLFDLQSRMQLATEDEYARLSANLWWSRITKVLPSQSKKEIVSWLLNTAKIEDLEQTGGKVTFEDIVASYTQFEPKFAGTGLRLPKAELEDHDGNGVNLAAHWSRDVGAYAAYWPQKQVASMLKNGESAGYTSYDDVTFFNNAHPLNPYRSSYGTFANVFTGAAASTPSTDPNDAAYPGACPIGDTVTVDVALANLSKAIGYIRSIRMPNGEDPRMLRPVGLIGGPGSMARLAQLTNAKFIAQAASSGGGSGDVEMLIQTLGFTQPIIADELAGFESNGTHFLVCEQLSSSGLGGLVYVEREPFSVRYYDNLSQAELGRMDDLEWHIKGRNVVGYGHPYLIFKLKAS